jgi:hypothetical protein
MPIGSLPVFSASARLSLSHCWLVETEPDEVLLAATSIIWPRPGSDTSLNTEGRACRRVPQATLQTEEEAPWQEAPALHCV